MIKNHLDQRYSCSTIQNYVNPSYISYNTGTAYSTTAGYKKEYYNTHKEKFQYYNREYYKKYKERIQFKKKIWFQKNKERLRLKHGFKTRYETKIYPESETRLTKGNITLSFD